MTVAALPSVVEYVTNGTSRTFAVPFRFKSGAHLVLTLIAPGAVSRRLAHARDFTTAGGATDAGGSVTLTVATAGGVLRIARATPRTQPMVYTPGDRFPAKSHEAALDAGIMMTQELDDALAATRADLDRLLRSTVPIAFDPGVDPAGAGAPFDPGTDVAGTLTFDPGVF